MIYNNVLSQNISQSQVIMIINENMLHETQVMSNFLHTYRIY